MLLLHIQKCLYVAKIIEQSWDDQKKFNFYVLMDMIIFTLEVEIKIKIF